MYNDQVKKEKQAKYYTKSYQLSSTNPRKNQGELRNSGRVGNSCSNSGSISSFSSVR